MAQNAPPAVDVQHIQFKLHHKQAIFEEISELRSNVDLLAVSSSGLVFAGNAYAPELRVAIVRDVVESKTSGKLPMRRVALPSTPNTLACNADGSMLALNYTQNGSGFLKIYSVASFLTPAIQNLYTMRISAEENVFVTQLLWNPVLTNSLGVVLSNGALAMYTLKDGGQFELHLMDSGQQVKCGCWSPKGKQIVLGFPNGKLQQFKPDLTPAKTIACPPGLMNVPFDTIAVHWLSTYQFAAIYLERNSEASPMLFIVNAPKGGTPTHINYNDICYSAPGPRVQQVSFTHIAQWNVLLVTSANGVEVGVLGTKDSNDTPTWTQYTLLDEARIELPLNDRKDETYPMGFALDISSTHQVHVGEQKLPVMPLIHVLSTHGHLVTFNFLNLDANAVGICSPPPPVVDNSGEYRLISTANTAPVAANKPAQPSAEESFALNSNAVTSTPASKEKPAPMFGAPTAMASIPGGNLFNQSVGIKPFAAPPTAAPNTMTFGGGFSGLPAMTTPAFGTAAGGGDKQQEVPKMQPQQPLREQPPAIPKEKPIEQHKPLYTVQPTFVPPEKTASQPQKSQHSHQRDEAALVNTSEMHEVVKRMIAIQINAFSTELKQLRAQSQGQLSNIGKLDEMKQCTKRLNDLQEINEQAKNSEFEMDVHNIRHSLNEFYVMLAECRSKLDMFNNPEITRLTSISTFDPINRRQLVKLQSYLASNQLHLQQLQQQIDAQWSNYQDLVHRNSKSHLHIPSLDGVYQRMNKLKDMIAHQRQKLAHIQNKLKQKGITPHRKGSAVLPINATKNDGTPTIESIADAILSMSLLPTANEHRSKFSDEKLQALRQFTQQKQKITVIKPQRPDRVGLKSEVVLETKLQTERRELEKASQQSHARETTKSTQASVEESTAAASALSKPIATKAQFVSITAQPTFASAMPAQTAATTNFQMGASSSPFVKPTFGAASNKPDETAMPSFGNPMSFAPSSNMTFGAAQMAQPKATQQVSAENAGAPKPSPFAPKVLGTSNVSFPTNAGKSLTQQSTPVANEKENAKTETKLTFGAAPDSTKPTESTSTSTLFSNKNFSFGAGNAGAKPTATGLTGFGVGGADSKDVPAKDSLLTTKPLTTPLFSGFGNSSGGGTVATFAAPTTSAPMPANMFSTDASNTTKTFSFGGFNAPLAASAAPSATTVGTTATNVTTSVAPALGDATDILSTLNVCKPTTKEPATDKQSNVGGGNIFGSLNIGTKEENKPAAAIKPFAGFGNEGVLFHTPGGATVETVKPPVATAAKAAETFSFGAAAAATTQSVTPLAVTTTTKPTTTASAAETTETTKTPAVTTTTATSQTPSASTFTFSLAGLETSATTANANAGVPLFGGLGQTLPLTTTVAATSTNPTATTTTASPLFGGIQTPAMPAGTIFGATATTAPTTTANIFSSAPKPDQSVFGKSSTAPPDGVFAAAAAAMPAGSIFGATATTAAASPFGATTAPTTTANIFSSAPKPDQSVFGKSSTAPPDGVFAAAAAATPSPFASPPAANAPASATSGGNIFGGNTTNLFGGSAGSSIFGSSGAAAAAPSTTSSPFGLANAAANSNTSGGSLFGNAAKSPDSGANIFGGNTVEPASGGGASMLGQSAFAKTPQSSGNIFGAPQQTPQQSTASPFGTGNSIFGGASSNAATTNTGSIFGGGSTAAGGAGASTFGGFSQQTTTPAFGSPNNSFGQAGAASVAQTGFGSPDPNAFAKPVFGAAPAFGSPPTFGGGATFGGAATFGSPKGFGFGSPSAAAPAGGGAFASPPAKNNLFEALGSTDTGLSFGNLAQTTNANQQKPTFGGSSFMNYRA